ncbi:fumarylacetoacetate hydrolase family protein [Propylenella binzhouense]|uniref:FAA hydrolase family protein n=1 Tax=Propylenella binzhouense TaxID=2555902 RepID=A0A964WT83_9HYPH|nr:fumarylacetoacetate hydrolase family protein [Propylenella binzhouense]MYZ47767.1 FAA hydrolase family protein [Propylenella binzhouense]
MKLVRFGEKGAEKPGAIDSQGRIRDLSGVVADFTPDVLTIEMRDRLTALDLETLPVVGGNPRLGAPIARTGHFIAIGLNYVDHAKEAGQPIPAEPVIFSKAPSSLSGPDDDVILPRGSEKGDWEIELGFVMGRHCHYVAQSDALSAVFGYVLANDVSERAFQIEGTGQWIKGKSAPTFGPIGPWLVTPDEIPDPQDLDMSLDVNGERRQTGNTRTMIFPVAELIAYLSEKMDLEPGDLVITGTPPGVGLGMRPQQFLKPGDEMHLTMAKLGEQRQKVVAFRG